MSDIVVSQAKKVNILDKIIQNVVIMVNISKMNRAIDEHLLVIKNTERDDQKVYQENILREIVYVKYQYDIMQRTMYELKLSYSKDIVDNINSMDKTERLKLQREFLEMEYDRLTRSKFKNKEDIKYMLLIISSVMQSVKQDIKDEGKSQKYNQIIKCAESIDTKIQQEEYTEECYLEMFENLKSYVNYINDNYDISKLPNDEKDIIELVIEATLNGLDSDIDRLNYEFSLIINVCKNAYRYFKIIDKVFVKIQSVYDDSLVRESINIQDYINFYKDIYDQKIKTMVNDVHRTIKVEDEYLEYSRQLHEDEGINEFMLTRALETTENPQVKDIISAELEKIVAEKLSEEETEEIVTEENEEDKKVEIIEEVYSLDGKTELAETENV
ncbi:MAG: hypothetical protein IKV94_00595 [Clostridia bacterium]|nr:hypothetical protein [Clostridia bacterium]